MSRVICKITSYIFDGNNFIIIEFVLEINFYRLLDPNHRIADFTYQY